MDGREHRWSLVLANGRFWPKAATRPVIHSVAGIDPKRPLGYQPINFISCA